MRRDPCFWSISSAVRNGFARSFGGQFGGEIFASKGRTASHSARLALATGEICNEAGLPKRCTSHSLRKAAATYLADRGATTTQLMAWFGWKTASEAERYTRGVGRKRARLA